MSFDSLKVNRLLAQVAARQQGQKIRHYVHELETTPGAIAGRAFEGDYDAWVTWALTVVAQLDPMTTEMTHNIGRQFKAPA